MLEGIIGHLDIFYIFICNIMSYIIIGCFRKDLSTGWKRLISTLVALAAAAVYIIWLQHDKEAIFCSFFVQYLMYDYVIKWFLKKLDEI